MLNPIKLLEQIQKIDLEIRAIEEEEKRYNQDIDGISAELKSAEAQIKALSAEIEELSAQGRAIETKIRENDEKIKRDESRINEIKNTKELNAVTKEISAASKAKKQGEQEKGALEAGINEKKGLLDAKESFFNDKNGELKRVLEELEKKKVVWTEEVQKKQRSRDSVKAELSPAIVKKYEAIRSKRGGTGIAPVKDETCQGCYIHIPPQVYIQLKKGTEELISCPHCHRILYVEEQNQTEAV